MAMGRAGAAAGRGYPGTSKCRGTPIWVKETEDTQGLQTTPCLGARHSGERDPSPFPSWGAGVKLSSSAGGAMPAPCAGISKQVRLSQGGFSPLLRSHFLIIPKGQCFDCALVRGICRGFEKSK